MSKIKNIGLFKGFLSLLAILAVFGSMYGGYLYFDSINQGGNSAQAASSNGVSIDKKYVVGGVESDTISTGQGGVVTVRLRYDNTNPNAVSGVSVKDTLPAGFTLVNGSIKSCLNPSYPTSTTAELVCGNNIPAGTAQSTLFNPSAGLSPIAGLYGASDNGSVGTSISSNSGLIEMGKKRYFPWAVCTENTGPQPYGFWSVTNILAPQSTPLFNSNVCSNVLPNQYVAGNLDSLNNRYMPVSMCTQTTGPYTGYSTMAMLRFTNTTGTANECFNAGWSDWTTQYGLDLDFLGRRYLPKYTCGFQNDVTGIRNVYLTGPINTPALSDCNTLGAGFSTFTANSFDMLNTARGSGYIEYQMIAPTFPGNVDQKYSTPVNMAGTGFSSLNDGTAGNGTNIGDITVSGTPIVFCTTPATCTSGTNMNGGLTGSTGGIAGGSIAFPQATGIPNNTPGTYTGPGNNCVINGVFTTSGGGVVFTPSGNIPTDCTTGPQTGTISTGGVSTGGVPTNFTLGSTAITPTNIGTSTDCTSATQVVIGNTYNCTFPLTGNANNDYNIPSGSFVTAGTSSASGFTVCSIVNNGTPQVALSCTGIPTTDGTAGPQSPLITVTGFAPADRGDVTLVAPTTPLTESDLASIVITCTNPAVGTNNNIPVGTENNTCIFNLPPNKTLSPNFKVGIGTGAYPDDATIGTQMDKSSCTLNVSTVTCTGVTAPSAALNAGALTRGVQGKYTTTPASGRGDFNTTVNMIIPTLGTPVATIASPITGVIGQPLPTIPLTGGNLPDGTTASFTPQGSSTAIPGTIVGGNFVPTPGVSNVIPNDATTGGATGVLSSPGVSPVNVPTNFSPATTPLTTADIPGLTIVCNPNPVANNSSTTCTFTLPSGKTLPADFKISVGNGPINAGGSIPNQVCTATGNSVSCTNVASGNSVGVLPINGNIGNVPTPSGESITVNGINFGNIDWIFGPTQGSNAPLFRSSDNTSIAVTNFRSVFDPTPTSNTRYVCSLEYRNLNDRLSTANGTGFVWTALGNSVVTPLPYSTSTGCNTNLAKSNRGNTLNHSLKLTIRDTTTSEVYTFYNEYIYRFQGAGVASGG